MSDSDDRFAFDEFPRKKLSFGFTRRQLWSVLTMNLQVYSGQGEGGSAFKLADLGGLPDHQLAGFTPRVISGCKITVGDGFVWGQPPDADQPVQLFPSDSPALKAFNLFNGQTSLAEVSRCLGQEMGWDEDRSFAYVRGLFLTLVLAHICQPEG
jgi:hypothetical protein